MASKALSLAKQLHAIKWLPLRNLLRQPISVWSWLVKTNHLRHPPPRMAADQVARPIGYHGFRLKAGGWAAKAGANNRGGRERLLPLAALSLGLGLMGNPEAAAPRRRGVEEEDGEAAADDALETACDRDWETADRALPRPRGLEELEFIRLIGSGGYSTVVEATAVTSTQSLAVKRHFNPGVESVLASLERQFDRELRFLACLSHPGVARIVSGFAAEFRQVPGDFTEAPAYLPSSHHPGGYGRNATYYTVMPLYDCSLADYLAASGGGGLSPVQSLLWLAQLAEADAYLKSRGVVHRDVKATNVAVRTAGDRARRLVLIDFGAATSPLVMSLPHDEVVRWGNSCLQPPEVARARPGQGSAIDYSRSDLWALCTLAWEMVGLGNPFLAPGGPRSCQPYSPEELPSLSERLGLGADRLLRRRALAEDPADRPPSEWVARALRRLLGEARRLRLRLRVQRRQLLLRRSGLGLAEGPRQLIARLPEFRVMQLLTPV